MNKISEKFRELALKKEGALVIGTVPGYPNLETSFEIIKKELKNNSYSVEFNYLQFNKEYEKQNIFVRNLVFDSLKSPSDYFNKNFEDYKEYFKSEKEEDIFKWLDIKEVGIEFNSSKILSFQGPFEVL